MRSILGNAYQPSWTTVAAGIAPSTASAYHRKLQWASRRAQYSSETHAKAKSPRHTRSASPRAVKTPRTVEAAPSQREPGAYKPEDLRRELSYLPDPVKLADRIQNLLKQGLIIKATTLVRLASKDMICTVSWNHVVNYHMEHGQWRLAEKTYNEMKKRAQKPDAHTYTILFRGLAKHAPHQNNLAQILSIYHSMFADNAPVKPSIIHTNAVLNACAFGGHMDAIWGIAAKLPTRGPSAPDLQTYTVILHALRNNIQKAAATDQIDRDHPGRREAVRQGAILSQEIIEKWRKGDLRLDEELVCAMGRILLNGTPEIMMQVFGLLDQTMGLPVPKAISDAISKAPVRPAQELDDGDEFIDDKEGSRSDRAAISDVTEKASKGSRLESLSSEHATSQSDVVEELENGDEFNDDARIDGSNLAAASVDLVKPGKPAKTGYVPPTNNALSLALEACRMVEVPKAAPEYYELLKGPKYKVLPDTTNYHEYLRCLRLGRHSELAMKAVQEMRERSLEPVTGGTRSSRRKDLPMLRVATFRVAMSACRRASHDQHAHKHAYEITRVMLESDVAPSCRALIDHATIVLKSPWVRDDWRALLEAEELIHEGWLNLRSSQSYTAAEDQEVIRLTGEMKVLASEMLAIYRRIEDLGREEAVPGDLAKAGRRSRSVQNWVQTQRDRAQRADLVQSKKPTGFKPASRSGRSVAHRPERRDPGSRISDGMADEQLLSLGDKPSFSSSPGRNARGIERREGFKGRHPREFRRLDARRAETQEPQLDGANRFSLHRNTRRFERRDGFKDRHSRELRRPDARGADVQDPQPDDVNHLPSLLRSVRTTERRQGFKDRRPRETIRPNARRTAETQEPWLDDADKFSSSSSSSSSSHRNARDFERREGFRDRRPREPRRPDARRANMQDPQPEDDANDFSSSLGKNNRTTEHREGFQDGRPRKPIRLSGARKSLR